MNRRALLWGALAGFTGVLLGAFGAHALSRTLDAHALSLWNKAVHYQLLHAPVLLACGLFRHPGAVRAATALALGILLFSGSLYLLALTGLRALGWITPLGGLALLLGWALLGRTAWTLPAA